jgi:hypothetical protein
MMHEGGIDNRRILLVAHKNPIHEGFQLILDAKGDGSEISPSEAPIQAALY